MGYLGPIDSNHGSCLARRLSASSCDDHASGSRHFWYALGQMIGSSQRQNTVRALLQCYRNGNFSGLKLPFQTWTIHRDPKTYGMAHATPRQHQSCGIAPMYAMTLAAPKIRDNTTTKRPIPEVGGHMSSPCGWMTWRVELHGNHGRLEEN